MDTFECIFSRRSIRKYADLDVSFDKLVDIVEAGRSAPCAGNVQNWRFIIVRDKELKRKLADAALQQYWVGTASAIIVVVDIPEKQKQFYGIRGEKLYSPQNCAAAIENILLAAHAQGLGACWIGAFEEEMVNSILSIPENARPQALVTIGYPDEIPPVPSKMDVSNTVFLEQYDKKIKDVDWVTGYYSATMARKIHAGKEFVEKQAGKVEKKIIPALQKVKEHIKRKLQRK